MATASRVIVLKAKDINSIMYDNYRNIDENKIADYYPSIKEVGVRVAVRVKKSKEGLTLIDGHHRVECARRIMKDYPHISLTMEAVVGEADETEAGSKSEVVDKVVANFTRRESIVDRATGYQLLKDSGKTIQQVADTVGKDRTTIENHLNFLTVYNEHKSLIEQNIDKLKDAFLYKLGQKFKRDSSMDVLAAIQSELSPKNRKGAGTEEEKTTNAESVLASAGYTKSEAKKICNTLRAAGIAL